MLLRSIKRIVIIGVILYVAILVILVANETSLVYPGSKYPRGNWTPTDFEFDEVEFESVDGTRLFGWYLYPPVRDEIDPEVEVLVETVLLCHGNAENVAQSAAYIGNMVRESLNAEVFVFDYRGFGKSEGTPNEQGVMEDSEAALAWLMNKSGKSADQIIIVGHSIGGAMAVHLAATQGAKALVLQRTFNAITEPAANKFPWLPIRYVMRNQLRSIDKIQGYPGPLLQSHGTLDRLIPVKMGRELFDAAPGANKEFVAVEGMGHLDPLPASYWSKLEQFIDNLQSAN